MSRKNLYVFSKLLDRRMLCPQSHFSTATNPEKSFANTLLLPRTSFPLRADPCVREAPFRERTSERLYAWQWENAKGPLFVLHDGPPYANGNLHMGHALNKILKDIINRYHVLLGYRVHYVPGWDCHGLPIENKALQHLGADHHSLSILHIRAAARKTAEREILAQKEEFQALGIMANWKADTGCYRTLDHDYEIRQLRVFKALVEKGLIYRQYRPVHYSPSSRTALAEAELTYVDHHISKSVYITFDAVLEGTSEHLREAIIPDGSELRVKLLVWTTTPWTLPTNMGIAVHSDLEYVLVRQHDTDDLVIVGRDLLATVRSLLGGITILHTFKGNELLSSRYTPLFRSSSNASLPIVHSNHVTSSSGTGLVHCAPAHGAEDYHVFVTQKLSKACIAGTGDTQEILCLVGPDGTFSEDCIRTATWLDPTVASRLTGKQVLTDGNAEVINILRERNNLVKEELIKHRYPYDWKTNCPIIVTATSQWFADLRFIKNEALDILQNVEFYPENGRNRLESFIKGRSEWCISRQRTWGVPIPALHDEATGETVLTPDSLEHIIGVLDRKGVEHWWSGPVEDFVGPALNREKNSAAWVKGVDTMDVWFDSGTSWTILPNSPLLQASGVPCLQARSLADVCLEGSDQHRGWFQSLLLTAVGFHSNVNSPPSQTKLLDPFHQPAIIRPYKSLITHGFVLDQEGKKMSKSAGNIISPMVIVKGGKDLKRDPAHGADVLRLWAATVEYGRDISVGPVVIQQAVESLRKIRNSLRFMLGNLCNTVGGHHKLDALSLADRYVMFELYQLERTAKEAYASYRFPQVVTALNRFAKYTLSSLYLDIAKDTLYADLPDSPRRRSVLWVMEQVLTTMKIVMAPILPHLSEELHDILNSTTKSTDKLSVFAEGWRSVGEEWHNQQIAQDMKLLLTVRGTVTGLLEAARAEKLIRSSLEVAVDIIMPRDMVLLNDPPALIRAIQEQELFLQTLFIVSDVTILDEGSLGVKSPMWSRSSTLQLSDHNEMINIRIRPSEGQKCPRCWTFSRHPEEKLCARCTETLK